MNIAMMDRISIFLTSTLGWIRRFKYLTVTAIFLVIIFVVDDKSVLKHFENQRTITMLEDEIKQMQKDSAAIMQKQEQLDSDCDVVIVEKLARDKYGMHKDNEDVYIIE